MEYGIILDSLNKQIKFNNEQFPIYYLSRMKRVADQYIKFRFAMNFIDVSWNMICINTKPSTLLYNVLNPDFEQSIIKTENPIIFVKGIKDRIRSFSRWQPYFEVNHWYGSLLQANLTNDESLRHRILLQLVDEARRILENIKCSSVVLWNDSLFIERVIAVAAHLENIPIFVVQDGIFHNNCNADLMQGWLADYILVWGKHFADLFYKKGVADKRNIFVLGYPWIIDNNVDFNISHKTRDICVIGSGYEDYDIATGLAETQVLLSICNDALMLGFDVTYRPHPTQWKSPRPYNLDHRIRLERNCSVQDSIRHHDIFIGINSTVLVETALYGKITIQVRVPEIDCDNFSDFNICYSVPYKDNIVKDILNDIKHARATTMTSWNDNYVKRRFKLEELSTVFRQALNSHYRS